MSDSNIEVNIDVNKNCKMFKNKLDLFDPEAKVLYNENKTMPLFIIIRTS